MTAPPLPFHAADIAALARFLEGELAKTPHPPGHLDLLNLLARGAGFGGYQALRASAMSGARMAEPAAMADLSKVAQARRYFNPAGRLAR